jgi:hypothetical protein
MEKLIDKCIEREEDMKNENKRLKEQVYMLEKKNV